MHVLISDFTKFPEQNRILSVRKCETCETCDVKLVANWSARCRHSGTFAVKTYKVSVNPGCESSVLCKFVKTTTFGSCLIYTILLLY